MFEWLPGEKRNNFRERFAFENGMYDPEHFALQVLTENQENVRILLLLKLSLVFVVVVVGFMYDVL